MNDPAPAATGAGFAALGLEAKLVAAVAAAGYDEPTPIQKKGVPPALEGRDLIGVARTGTGKTAAFGLPLLQRLARGRARARMPRALILEPTRELANQVADAFAVYGANYALRLATLIGGVSFGDQKQALNRGPDVIIATPGRLLDHCERGAALLLGVETLIIDEADRMLDMGFIPDIERIARMTPPRRQTMLFSATMPDEIQRIARAYMRDAARVEADPPAATAETVEQFRLAAPTDENAKRDLLRALIQAERATLTNAIIFCNRKRDVATLHRVLARGPFSVGALHGDMDQHARLKTLATFREGGLTLLVASDVAARGLDIPQVSHVFNYDTPFSAENYVHRIGRTGRAGRAGRAFTLVAPNETEALNAIHALIGDKIPQADPPRVAPSSPSARPARRAGASGPRARRSSGSRRRRAPAP